MKKTLALLLCLVMALSVLTACGSSNTAASTADQSTASDSTGSDAAAAPAGTGHKETLVIGTAEDINNLNLQTQKTANNNIILKTTHQTLVFFNNDPEVIAIGYTRLLIIFSAYTFSMLYEVMSGYLRGFGISLVPAVLTTLGVCGVRISWIQLVFPLRRTFSTIMIAYPASLSTTALLIGIALFVYQPSRRYAAKQAKQYAGC